MHPRNKTQMVPNHTHTTINQHEQRSTKQLSLGFNHQATLRAWIAWTGFMVFLFFVKVTFAYSTVVDRVVAIVNQEIITLSELERINTNLENPLFEQLSIEPPRLSEKQQLQETLRILIEKKLQLQAARKRGITVAREELQQALNEIKIRQGIANDSTLEQILSEGNMTLSDYTQEIKDQITILKLINREIRSGIVLQKSEITAYYNAHPEYFTLPGKIRIAQLLISIPRAAQDKQIQDLLKQAQKIRSHILGGGDFGGMARKYSDGPEADQGGDIGYFEKGELMEEIEPVVFSLNEGDVSNVVRSPLGFHIFKLLERKSGGTLPYQEVRSQVQELLLLERTEMAYKLWIKRLRDQAYVEVKM
jgi:peptidyl-prolyl cis-trans isomerase SurA